MPDHSGPSFAKMLVEGEVEQSDIWRFIDTYEQEPTHTPYIDVYLGIPKSIFLAWMNDNDIDLRKALREYEPTTH